MRFALNFKLARADGQLFISEPNLRYLLDSSKHRASTVTAAHIRCEEDSHQHTVTLPLSATLIQLFVFYVALWIYTSCAAGLSWT